ncbi:MAG: hypothetical protein HQL10_02925 [Nitrospirae bacterium]|nr:hypothetical protein [Nitrospirota bacterium]
MFTKTLKHSKKLTGYILLIAIALVLSSVMMFGHIFPLDSIFKGHKPYDPGIMVWNLYTVNEAVKTGAQLFHTNMIFYPNGTSLGNHTLGIGYFPLTFFVDMISGGSPLYPVYALNLCILCCFAGLFLFSYLTLTELGYKPLESAAPAIAFSFCNFLTLHSFALNLIGAFVLPLTAYLALRFYKTKSFGYGLALSFSLGGMIYFTEFSFFVFISSVLLLIVLLVFPAQRSLILNFIRSIKMTHIVFFGCVTLGIMFPYLFAWFSAESAKPLAIERVAYSANFIDFVLPREHNHFFYAKLFGGIYSFLTNTLTTEESFIGYPLILFSVIALLVGDRSRIKTPCIMAFVFFVLSLGPKLKLLNGVTEIPMPYSLFESLPFFSQFRTPVRLIVFGMFFLMIASAEGISVVVNKLRHKAGGLAGTIIICFFIFWTVAEVYPGTPSKEPVSQSIIDLHNKVLGPVINLPIVFRDGHALLLQIFHRKPMATGDVSRFSQDTLTHFKTLKDMFAEMPDNLCSRLENYGYKTAIISQELPESASQTVQKCNLQIIDISTKTFKN